MIHAAIVEVKDGPAVELFEFALEEPALHLAAFAIFIDRSVLEAFANDTVCVTKIITPLKADATLEVQATGGRATASRVEVWPIKTIW